MTALGAALVDVAGRVLAVDDLSLVVSDRNEEDRRMLREYAALVIELNGLGASGPTAPGSCDDFSSLVGDYIAAEQAVTSSDLDRATRGDFSPLTAYEQLLIDDAVRLYSKLRGALREVLC